MGVWRLNEPLDGEEGGLEYQDTGVYVGVLVGLVGHVVEVVAVLVVRDLGAHYLGDFLGLVLPAGPGLRRVLVLYLFDEVTHERVLVLHFVGGEWVFGEEGEFLLFAAGGEAVGGGGDEVVLGADLEFVLEQLLQPLGGDVLVLEAAHFGE